MSNARTFCSGGWRRLTLIPACCDIATYAFRWLRITFVSIFQYTFPHTAYMDLFACRGLRCFGIRRFVVWDVSFLLVECQLQCHLHEAVRAHVARFHEVFAIVLKLVDEHIQFIPEPAWESFGHLTYLIALYLVLGCPKFYTVAFCNDVREWCNNLK